MGTHPIFESDFDCLTENGNFKSEIIGKIARKIKLDDYCPLLRFTPIPGFNFIDNKGTQLQKSNWPWMYDRGSFIHFSRVLFDGTKSSDESVNWSTLYRLG